MKITRNKAYERQLLRMIETKYREEERLPDGKRHVYDLLFLRKTVACELYGCPLRPQDVGFFFLGKAIHGEMQRILGIGKAEISAEKYGVVGTLDWRGNKALEIKSSRKWTVPDYVESRYVRQAGYYAVVHDLNTIFIPIVYPTAGRTWQGKKASTVDMRAWRLDFTKADKAEILYDIKESVKAIEKAVRTKSFKGLPPVGLGQEWVLERFDGEVPAYDKRPDMLTLDEHPFWYAWRDHRKL